MTITIKITSKDSNKWLSIATQKAKEKSEERRVAWIDADVYVELPERGRCFIKKPGFTTMGAYC